jgi:hypothetical protein
MLYHLLHLLHAHTRHCEGSICEGKYAPWQPHDSMSNVTYLYLEITTSLALLVMTGDILMTRVV